MAQDDSTKLMSDLTALQEEFGLTFALTDPDEAVTTEQRTINNLFFALLEARRDAMLKKESDEPLATDAMVIERITELEAQVRWLRDYAISKASEVHQMKVGAMPAHHELGVIIGGIDGNMAIAAERAKRGTDA